MKKAYDSLDRLAIADQVLGALGGKKGDTPVQCLRCGIAEFVVFSALKGGGVGMWTCHGCEQVNEVRLHKTSTHTRVETKLPEAKWES